jgi:hypothetical protein
MTIEELYAAWARYMHRSDLAADLDLTYLLSGVRIKNDLLFSPVDLDAILLDEPQLYLHAGLLQLAELAQDDEQAQREGRLFAGAVSNFTMQRSIEAGPSKMSERITFGVNDQAVAPIAVEEA